MQDSAYNYKIFKRRFRYAHFPGIDTGSCHTQLDSEVTLCQSGSFAKIVALKPSQLL